MIKRNIVLLLGVFLCVTTISQIGKRHFKDIGLCDVNCLEDMDPYSFYFESVDLEEEAAYYEKYKDKYIKEMEELQMIYVAAPTGNYKMGTSTGMQEVRVTRVIQGSKELENQCVWIDGMPGLAYGEEDELYMDMFLNYMQKDNEYLIFCDAYGPINLREQNNCSKYYVTDSIFGYVNITNRDNTGKIIDKNQKYTMKDLNGYEFFADCKEVLEIKQAIKEELIEKFLKEY